MKTFLILQAVAFLFYSCNTTQPKSDDLHEQMEKNTWQELDPSDKLIEQNITTLFGNQFQKILISHRIVLTKSFLKDLEEKHPLKDGKHYYSSYEYQKGNIVC